jgi:L-proline cis-4-hydroxylase
MRTQYVTTVPLDRERLTKDLAQSESFQWSEAYSDYLFGGPWKSCMLWACGGDAGDGVVTNYAYDRPPALTGYGKQVPYLQELITATADLARLNFVRLAKVSHSVIIPHRDLLELNDLPDDARNAHRVHIPLATNEDALFSEGNTVFHMGEGEVWFLDASQIHSVAALADEPRIHLIFDFVGTASDGPLLNVEPGPGHGEIRRDRLVNRPPLPEADSAALLRLAEVLTMDTFSEIFSIVIKKHYRFDGGEDFAWNTITAIAQRCADPRVLAHTLELRRYFTLERSA